MRRDLSLRADDTALRLGAQVAWQNKLPVDALLTDDATFVVARGVLSSPPASSRARWIVVMPSFGEGPRPFESHARYPYPAGATENRWSHRRRVREERVAARADQRRAIMTMRTNVARPPPGSLAAFPAVDGSIHLEAIQ